MLVGCHQEAQKKTQNPGKKKVIIANKTIKSATADQ